MRRPTVRRISHIIFGSTVSGAVGAMERMDSKFSSSRASSHSSASCDAMSPADSSGEISVLSSLPCALVPLVLVLPVLVLPVLVLPVLVLPVLVLPVLVLPVLVLPVLVLPVLVLLVPIEFVLVVEPRDTWQ